MAGDPASERPNEAEGGPVKTFLEHLEDLRWVLIKSLVALGVAVLLCLLAGNYVVQIVKWPLTRAKLSYPGANQVVAVSFGTNRLGAFQLTAEQQKLLNLGTNRFVSVQVEPLVIGTNQVLGWRASSDPDAVADAQRLKIDLINLSPAGGFVVAFQVAIYGGTVLASPFIFYFVATFIFPALKLRERKYIYRGLAFGGGLFLLGVAFCYFALMPLALAAAQMYSHWLGFGAFQWRAEDYISFVCKFLLGMGLGFELPVVIPDARENRRARLSHALRGAPLCDRHQSDPGRGADHPGTDNANRHVRAAAGPLRNHRLDCVVLGPAGPETRRA
jgi:sec-independent protein translocase protein TatC